MMSTYPIISLDVSRHAGWPVLPWLLLIAIALLWPVAAPAHTDFAAQVSVDHALLRTAKAGDNAVLKLRIQNRSSSIIHLLRVETPVAEGSRIVFDKGNGQSATLDSLAVRPGDELDLASSHMWIELIRLNQPLRDGDHVPLRLVFSPGGWVDIVGDVGAHHDH